MLGAELENVLAYSFHALGFVKSADIVTVAENTFVSNKQIGTYMSGWNASTHLLISRFSDDGGENAGGGKRDVIIGGIGGGGITFIPGMSGGDNGASYTRTLRQVATSDALSALKVTWFDGTPREVLGANEIVISENVWRELQANEAKVTLTAEQFGAYVDACFGNGYWAMTNPNHNYGERLVDAYKRIYLASEIERVATDAEAFVQIKAWFASNVPEYTAPIEDAATLKTALRWYFFGEDGTQYLHEQENVGYGSFIDWSGIWNAQTEVAKAFVAQLNQIFGTSFTAEEVGFRGWAFIEFFNSFNANDTEESFSFTYFEYALRELYAQKDLQDNGYFLTNSRFVEDLLACQQLDVTEDEWQNADEQTKREWARQFYINYFMSWSEYRDYEPYVEGAKTQAEITSMSKQMVLKLSGKTELELLGTLTFERIVESYENGTNQVAKSYDFVIVGTFEDKNYSYSDVFVSDTLYNDYQAWYVENAGKYSYTETVEPHEEGIWSFALAALSASDRGVVEQLVTMTYDRETGLQFQMQNAVMNTLATFNDFIEEGAKIFLYIGLGFAVFSSLLLMNFISTSISYKKREIGILRAVGARSSDVFKIFFSEALIIALINFIMAGIALIATTIALNTWMRNSGINITLLNVGVRQIALMLGVSVLVALLSSFLPVNGIARKKPVDAIKDR